GGPLPEELPALLAALLAEAGRLPREASVLLASLLAELPDRDSERDPAAARHPRATFDLLDRPPAWAPGGGLGRGGRGGGGVAQGAAGSRRLGEAGESLPEEPLPNEAREPVLLDAAERRAIDLAFAEALPRLFMEEAGGEDPRDFFRKGQHDLARRF